MFTNTQISYIQDGVMRSIQSKVKFLKKEGDAEILYTAEGIRIPLDNLISMNGVSWT
jgi:hypothetical protein